MRDDFGTRPYSVRFPYKSKKSTKSQSMKDRRDESYGKWGSRPNQKINR